MSGNGTFWRDLAPLRWWSLAVLLVFGLACGVGGYFAFGADSAGKGVEAGCLAMLGVVLARGFVSLMVHFAPAQDTSAGQNAAILVFLGFFFFPPFVLAEIVVWLCRRRFFSSRLGLLTMASVVGGFTGFMDGG